MEDWFSHSLWTFWVYCDAIRSHECTYSFPAYDEWYFLRFSRYLHYNLPGWHLIYSKPQEEHDKHVRQVLRRLWEYSLYAKLEKSNFGQNQVEFLGYVISSDGIYMDPTKIQTILDWQIPLSVRDVQCFLGFAIFYQKIIKIYSKVVLPLTQLTQTSTIRMEFRCNRDIWKFKKCQNQEKR